MSKRRLIKRFTWLYRIEKLHAFVTFPLIILYALTKNPCKESVFLIYGLLFCSFILYQGQLYWKLKFKRLRGEVINNEKNIKLFHSYNKINRILMGLIPFIFITQMELQNWSFENKSLFILGLVANIFAVLEHINYYHTQLMIDNLYDFKYVIKNKKLKKASIAKDLLDGEI